MSVSLDLYNIFYRVCELGSISKAAEYFFVTQPSVTKNINNLEKMLGQTLLERGHRGVKLTEQGQKLYESIKEPIEILNSLENKLQGNNKNIEIIIKIIAGQSTIKNLLLDAISKYNKKYPNVVFEVNTFPYDEAIQKLREGATDLIFFSMKEVSTEYSNIVIKEFIDLHDIFVVNESMKNKFPGEIDILNLNYYPLCCKRKNDVTRKWIEEQFAQNDEEFKPKYELSSSWVVEEYARRGMGIGIVAEEFVKDELESGKLIKLKTKQDLPVRRMGYAMRKNSGNYDIIKEFVKGI